MIRPSKKEIRQAAQIPIVMESVDRFLARLLENGRLPSAETETHFYYLGPTGEESEERVSEQAFRGQDEENPRQAGYYAVEVVSIDDGRPLSPKPWVAIFRDQSLQQERRERTAEAGFGELLEEYRILHAHTKRELQEQIREKDRVDGELRTFSEAYNIMRQKALSAEIERDEALLAAERMEHEKGMVVQRCRELEEEAASFRPQINQMIEGFVEFVAPRAQEMFVAASSGFGGEEGEGAGSGGKKKPTPPWAGGGGGKGARGDRAGASAVGGEQRDGGSERPADGKEKPSPASDDPEMPTPEALSRALYYLFWEVEQFGRFANEKAKDENGDPLVPWWVIRGIVYYHTHSDIGPTPLWPSDVKKVDPQGEPSEAQPASVRSKGKRTPPADVIDVEPEPDDVPSPGQRRSPRAQDVVHDEPAVSGGTEDPQVDEDGSVGSGRVDADDPSGNDRDGHDAGAERDDVDDDGPERRSVQDDDPSARGAPHEDDADPPSEDGA